MKDDDIHFAFEGKPYRAPADFYNTGYAALPDGRIVQADGWLETYPPQPAGLKVVPVSQAVEV